MAVLGFSVLLACGAACGRQTPGTGTAAGKRLMVGMILVVIAGLRVLIALGAIAAVTALAI